MQKTPKRIAMIGHKYIPSRDGGVEVVVSNLAPHLVKIGYDVTCYNRTNQEFKKMRKSAPLPREYRGVHLIWTPTVDRRGLAAMTSSIIATVMASFRRFDIVHFHTEGPCVLCWLPRLFGKKVVVTVHGLDHQRQKWGKFASAYILLGERMAARYAHSIIVLSKGVQAYFREKYGRETVMIPNGIDPAQTRPAAEITKQFGLSAGDYILFLGRLVPEKGIHYLMEAYGKLSTDKKLVIVGGTSDTDDYVKHLHELAGGNPSIIFTGFQQGKVLDELYSNCYVYCLPSDLEGMPLSLLEAMSYGCCCLVSDIPECTEVVGDKAAVFKKGSIDDLREKLCALIENEELAESYRKGAADYILKKYDWDRITRKTLSLYTK